MLDTIAGISYRECTYGKIADKLENISHHNKGWSTRKSNTRRNTFAVEATNNQSAHEISEEMAQIRRFGFFLKHVSRPIEKVNTLKYFTRPPPPTEKYYDEVDAYEVNLRQGVSDQHPRL